jgi:hypothetical protein
VLALPYPTAAPTRSTRASSSRTSPIPSAALGAFASQLAPRGGLLLDEVEWIRSDGARSQRYLALVEAVLASQGQCLFVGAAPRRAPPSATRRRDRAACASSPSTRATRPVCSR